MYIQEEAARRDEKVYIGALTFRDRDPTLLFSRFNFENQLDYFTKPAVRNIIIINLKQGILFFS